MTNGITLTADTDKTEMDVILDDVSFSYVHMETEVVSALSDVSLSLERGSYTALLGRNGSGKSTMAKLIDVLELPQEGNVLVVGRNTNDESVFWEIRTSCGMVFQNPDNQIVGTTVEEDVAFGPENLGIPTAEIRRRVDEALRYVGLTELSLRQPSQLSGGQKQKLAIAGILAMSPQILLLDESTSMLDPLSRDEFLSLVEKLVREKHMTVLHITHDMSEACLADRVIVLSNGKVALSGTPGEVFSQVEAVRNLGLDVPVFADLAYTVSERLGLTADRSILYSRGPALAGIREMLRRLPESYMPAVSPSGTMDNSRVDARTVLKVSHLSHFYEKGGAPALDDVSFSVREGEIFAIIGHSGSGKTTLITHLNGLMRPESGDVFVYPKDRAEPLNVRRNADVRSIRRLVGLLFQYPEYQLFEETVRKDIAFGPKKMGLKDSEIEEKVMGAIRLLGLDESILERSPFELSGGQKRRVAFAGVIAMDPDILVLDEPAAGLDPTGRREILEYAAKLKALGKTVIIVSHNMDEAAKYADRILVLKNGKATLPMTPRELFTDEEQLKDLGLAAPEIITCLRELKKEIPEIRPCYFRSSDAADEIIRAAVCARKARAVAAETAADTAADTADGSKTADVCIAADGVDRTAPSSGGDAL